MQMDTFNDDDKSTSLLRASTFTAGVANSSSHAPLHSHGSYSDGGHHVTDHHFGPSSEPIQSIETDQRARLVKLRKEADKSGIFSVPFLVQRPALRAFWEWDGQRNVLVRPDEELTVTWNELFYDLIFVVAYATLGHSLLGKLGGDPTTQDLREFIVSFASLTLVWMSTLSYVNRYDSSDLLSKTYYGLMMGCVIGLSVNGFYDRQASALAYISARLLTDAMHIFAAYFEEKAVEFARMNMLMDMVSVVPVFISIFVSSDKTGLYLWEFGIGAQYLLWILRGRVGDARLPIIIEHICERFGLFTILILGEQISALVFAGKYKTDISYTCSALGLLSAFAIQTVYYDVESESQYRHAIRVSPRRGLIWYMLHMPLQLAILLSSVGCRALINRTLTEPSAEHADTGGGHDAGGGGHDTGHLAIDSLDWSLKEGHELTPHTPVTNYMRLLYCCGNGAILTILTFLGLLHQSHPRVHIAKTTRCLFRFGFALIIFMLPLAGDDMGPLGYIAIVASTQTGMALLEVYGSNSTDEKKRPRLVSVVDDDERSVSGLDVVHE